MLDFETQWTSKGFNDCFGRMLKTTRGKRNAYKLTEIEHVKRFGHTRYSSYDSFKSVLKKFAFTADENFQKR